MAGDPDEFDVQHEPVEDDVPDELEDAALQEFEYPADETDEG